MTVASPRTLEFGLFVNGGHKNARIEGIRKLRAAKNHPFDGREVVVRKPFLHWRVTFTSPVGVHVGVSKLSVAELERVAFEQAIFGPFLGIIEADVNLSDESIRKCDENLVLGPVSYHSSVSFSNVLRTDQIREQAVQTRIFGLFQIHQRFSVSREMCERIVLVRETSSRSKEVFVCGSRIFQVVC